MKRTVGNYTSQSSPDFPLDAEGLAAIQSNAAMLAILGNIAGDKAILLGCEPTGGGASRNPGYLFVKTADYPDGEVVYFEGGSTAGGMYLKKETIAIAAYRVDYPQAYTVRSLAPGVGAEQYDWADFSAVATNRALAAQLGQLAIDLAAVGVTPLGVPMPFCGLAAPACYDLCDGQTLAIADYPALYAAIGSAFNTAPDANGNPYAAPAAGYFRLPDLRGRFIVGYNAADTDYNALGKAGGEKLHALTEQELPPHRHSLFLQNSGTRFTGGGSASELNSGAGQTGSTGGNEAHENRPPYYTLNYIIRIQ